MGLEDISGSLFGGGTPKPKQGLTQGLTQGNPMAVPADGGFMQLIMGFFGG
jgi:hypothetical protein